MCEHIEALARAATGGVKNRDAQKIVDHIPWTVGAANCERARMLVIFSAFSKGLRLIVIVETCQ
jgi:hypothetical protein